VTPAHAERGADPKSPLTTDRRCAPQLIHLDGRLLNGVPTQRTSLMKIQKRHRQPLRIMCADDNRELVELIAESLQFYGYRVEWAYDGKEALSTIAVEPEKFDLLITDMDMPHLDGYELVVQAQALGFRGKVIVFAGALSAQDRERFGALSVEAIIDKPANHRQLIGVVARLQTELWEQSNADAA